MNKIVKDIEHDDESLNQIKEDLLKNIKIIIIMPIIIGIITLFITYFIEPTYKARAIFIPPQQQQTSTAALLSSLGGVAGMAGAAAGFKNPIEQYVMIMKSEIVQNNIIDEFKLMESYKAKDKYDAREKLKGRVNISVGKEGLISIESIDEDPKKAADIANKYVLKLSERLNMMAVDEAYQRRIFYEEKLVKVKKELNEAEEELKKSGISRDNINTNPLIALNLISSLNANINSMEIKLLNIKQIYNPESLEYKTAVIELENLKAQLKKQGTNSPVEKNKFKKAEDGNYINKFREYKNKESLHEILIKQFEAAKLDESKTPTILQIVDYAEQPERKFYPNKRLITLTSIITTLLIIIFIIITRNLLIKK